MPVYFFAKYTGQEDSQVRERIQTTPPNIILTNYMMLELLMTRAGDENGSEIVSLRIFIIDI